MFSESNDQTDISDLMSSTEIIIGCEKYNFSYDEFSGLSSVASLDRAFVYQQENQVDKLFQLTPNTSKFEANYDLNRLNMQDPNLIQSLIVRGSEIVNRCEELDTSKVPAKVLQEVIEIEGKTFTITYLPENSMYRETYEKRIRNRIKRVGE